MGELYKSHLTEDLAAGFLLGSVAALLWTTAAILVLSTVGTFMMIAGTMGLFCLIACLRNYNRFVTEIKTVVNCIQRGEGGCKLRGFHFSCKKGRLYVTTPSGKLYEYRIVERNYVLGNGNDVCKSEREFEWIMMVNSITKYTFYKIQLNISTLRFARLGRDIYIDYKDTRVTLKRIRTKKE